MLIAFSGLKGSGKDTAASILINEYGFTKIAFADALREALLILDPWIAYAGEYKTIPLSELIADAGWDWAKTNIAEVRRLMQVFGTEVGRMLFGENVWVDILAKRYPDISDSESRYVITDCRFKNEVDFVHSFNGDICWVERPEIVSDGHASETTEISQYASYLFNNDSTIEDLAEDVRFFLFLKGVEPIDNSAKLITE